MFNKPKVTEEEPELSKDSGYANDKAYADNAQKIALAHFNLQKEALQMSLDIMWKTMLLAVASIFVSGVAVAIAILK